MPGGWVVRGWMTESEFHVNPTIELSNADIAMTKARQWEESDKWKVEITLTPEGKQKLADLTEELLGGSIVLVVGAESNVISVNVKVKGGYIPLSHGYDEKAAVRVARGLVRSLE